ERGFGYRILAAKAGNIARLQEILDWIPGTVFESQNTLSHCGGGHQPCDEGCIAPAASLVMGVNVGLPNAGSGVAAEAEAKAVVHDVRLRPADPIGVPAISVQARPTVVFIKRAMVCVRTALGDEYHVCPAPQA